MNLLNPSLASLFDALANELQSYWVQERAENVSVSWSGTPEDPAPDVTCRSWTLSVDSASRIIVAAPPETWKELSGLGEDASPDDLRIAFLSCFTPAIEQTVRSRFGSEVTCVEEDQPQAPPPEWTAVNFTITRESGIGVSIQVGVNPDLELALGIPQDPAAADETAGPITGSHSAAILMDVEMPVSIALGRTKMRLKELLQLTNGSVVELDQDLGDEVEIRVNNHVIAYGEVVAVDGNYAVRVMRMAQPRNAALRGILPEKAA
jgi:flagellar motor switch protein FliN